MALQGVGDEVWNVSSLNGNPRDHKVNFSMSVSANDYDDLMANVPEKFRDRIEMHRECAIMKDVMGHPGANIVEKIDKTLADWAMERPVDDVRIGRYHLKYRY